MSVTEDEKDEIRIVRALLLHYISDTGYDINQYNIYQRIDMPGREWSAVQQNVGCLAKDSGIHIELDQYPQTKLITITLTPDE